MLSSRERRETAMLQVSEHESVWTNTHPSEKCLWNCLKSSAVTGSDASRTARIPKNLKSSSSVFTKLRKIEAEETYTVTSCSIIQSAKPVTPLTVTGKGHSAAPFSRAQHVNVTAW